MQPPIPTGTILQNRYRLISLLGQGGFGRTYLAEDQGRFNERCALKEFIPAQSGAYVLEKSKELFQREAAILYQIQHPQIPQFRATFEQDQRLFLVQDYVEGKTYGALLDERKAQGYTFSEAEVLQLMRQLLPVLAHIHSKGIIHRDIAPDNIMLRESDRLPVLIDFGVVKELVTRIQMETVHQPTTVGKLGYAPSEQLQTGRAYPSSDLYALAVTAIVLLTGREPQAMFNDNTLTWHWQQGVTVSPGFAQVLNKMLSYKPGDRYQSVSEVVLALQALAHPTVASTVPVVPSGPSTTPTAPVTTPTPPHASGNPANTNLSEMQTLAVGRRPDLVSPNPAPNSTRPDPVIPTASNSSPWEDPWAVIAIGTVVALIAGLGTWALVSSALNRSSDTASPTPSVALSPSPVVSPSPTPTPSAQPVSYSQRLNLAADGNTSVEGNVKANTTINYLISGEQGQQFSAFVSGEGALMTILGPNQEPLNDRARRVSSWEGALPFTGDYTIQLSPVQGITESDYKLDLSLTNPATPTPTPPPPPAPSPAAPAVDVEPVNFQPGESGAQISAQANPGTIKRYLVNAQEGQVLSAKVLNGSVTLDIRYPDGQLVEDAGKLLSWQGQLPRSGQYQIDVVPVQDTDFTVDVSVTQ
jgi:serine/threonine-protein kinase